MTDPIPQPPLVYRPSVFSPAPGVRWDPNLSQTRVENDKVLGVACGYSTPLDLADGDTYYKLIDAAFIDEIAANGRHTIEVDVVDTEGRRINGARVWHGWPTHRLPEYDGRVEAMIFGGNVAQWPLYEPFDAWVDAGPYWVQPAGGKADIFWGAGLPWKRHVCFSLVFRQTIYRAQPQEPPEEPGSLEYLLLTNGERNQVIQFNPEAALQKRIFADSFVPNSPEFEVRHLSIRYVGQRAEHLASGEVRVYYAAHGDWDNVRYVVRR